MTSKITIFLSLFNLSCSGEKNNECVPGDSVWMEETKETAEPNKEHIDTITNVLMNRKNSYVNHSEINAAVQCACHLGEGENMGCPNNITW